MRIINNSVAKVKALAKAEGVAAAAGEEEREIVVVVEEPQKPQQQEQQQPFHQQQQHQPQHQQLGDRIYQVTDGLKSNYTKRDYGYAFKQFLRDGAKTGDLQVLLDYKPKVIEQMVIGYVEMLRDKGHASKTIYLHCSAIFHFFEMNDIVLNRGKITRFIPPDESPNHLNSDKAYTLEQIGRILESCDERASVIVSLMASTGMRIGAIPGLRVGDLTPIQCPDFSLYKIAVYAESRKDRYFTYCSPECRIAIDSYLDFRRRQGETIKDKSPLIREVFNVRMPYFVNAPRSASRDGIQRVLEKVLNAAGINQRPPGLIKKKRRSIMRSHGFRKFVITTMVKAGVKDTHRRYLTNHAQVGQDASYVLPTEDEILEEYIKAIPLLTIHSESRLKQQIKELQTERFQNLEDVHKKWLTELKDQYSLIPKREWETMKVEMKAIKEDILPEYYKSTGKPIHLDASYTDSE